MAVSETALQACISVSTLRVELMIFVPIGIQRSWLNVAFCFFDFTSTSNSEATTLWTSLLVFYFNPSNPFFPFGERFTPPATPSPEHCRVPVAGRTRGGWEAENIEFPLGFW